MKWSAGVSLSFAGGVSAGAILQGTQTTAAAGLLLVICLLSSIRKMLFLLPALFFLGVCSGSVGMEMLESGLLGSTVVLNGFSTYVKSVIDNMPMADNRVAGLLKALITADRSGLEPEVISAFRSSGASHILALSGMHIGIIYIMLDKLFIPLGRRPSARIIRSSLIVMSAAAFTVFTGASPSLVRAFLFILLKETASLTCRCSDPVSILFGSLTIQLAVSPWNIVMPGFQLSYLAMTGIYFIYPRMKRLWPESRFSLLKVLWNSASLSISCQILTGPLAWYHFRTFPQFFIITNLLAMPLTTILMFTAIPSVVLSAIGICPSILLKVCSLSCTFLIKSLELISLL